MRAPSTFPRRAAAVSTPLSVVISIVLLASSNARGQDPFANEGAAEPTPKPTGAPGPALAPPPPAEAAQAEEDLGHVERLPGTAYPAWTIRGIEGGSLWFSGNMHGMPWPYYPRTGIGVSGYSWFDTGYEKIERGNPSQSNLKYLLSQARAVLRVTPTYSLGEFYLQAQTELVANKDQSWAQPNVADVDDLWVRFGQWKKWDVQVGRFEAFEVYHFGMGLDLNTLERDGASDGTRSPPDVPGLRNLTYRQSGAGNVALHIYLASFIRFELLGQFGFENRDTLNAMAVRPALVLDFGFLKLKGEVNYRSQFPLFESSLEKRTQSGGSGAAQLVLSPVLELGGNFAYGIVDHWNAQNTTDPMATLGTYDGLGSTTDISYGGFLNARPLPTILPNFILGVGGNYITQTDQVNGFLSHTQGFVALQYLIGRRLFVKAVAAYAKASIDPGEAPPAPGEPPPPDVNWENTMVSGRLRLMYLF